jgi:nitric oxide reductase NorD protein
VAEPEDVISDAARHALIAAKRLWRRAAPVVTDEGEAFSSRRRRLELLLVGAYGRDLRVRVAQPPAPPSLLRRMFGPPRSLRHLEALPGTDGANVFLPLDAQVPSLPSERLLRLLALQQGGRAIRGSADPRWIPADALAGALYELGEAVAADRRLAKELPGVRADLLLLRGDLLAQRPRRDGLTPLEWAFEELVQAVLGAGELHTEHVPSLLGPAATLAWAQARATSWEQAHGGTFRAFRRDLFLGMLPPSEASRVPKELASRGAPPPEEDGPPRSVELRRRPDVREEVEGEDDGEPGPWMLQMDDPLEHVEDPMGIQRPTDRGADGEGAPDSLSELQEARVVTTPERAQEIFVTDDPPQVRSTPRRRERRLGVVYPEWDHRIGAYHPAGATVWVGRRAQGSATWAQEVMERRRLLFEQVRRRFEALRPRRVQLGRQEDGEELDLDALVSSHVDRVAGLPFDDRFYRTTRPLRRDLAISLLVDVSGSTDAWVGEDLRVVDVEKEALLLCCHALDALGDPYAIEAFSGEGPHGVEMWQVKGFEEMDRVAVERRIADLEPDDYTRAGAALRHATAGLAARHEQHRLLLLLSDGKPNDEDHYGGVYGVEDMRQAVHEAIAAGISVFCLTVDREAPTYLPRIFGPWRSTTLAHANELPVALVEALRHLIRR